MVETRRLNELEGRLHGLLDIPEGPLVVALSGGADSATLAYLLQGSDRRLRAIHVNHGYPASAMLEGAARLIATRLELDLEVSEVEVPIGASAEGQARQARYEVLVSGLRPGEWLLTAHTLDDQAETVVMNLLRGTGPTGLTGIPGRSRPVARPLLGARRSETRELAGLAGLPFLDDPANLDPGIRRNVIRLELLPMLSGRFNPRLVESLARTASLLWSEQQVLEHEADELEILARGDTVAVAIGALLAVPGPIADRVVRRCLARVRPPHSGTALEVATIRGVISREREAARISGEIEVRVEGPLLVFRSAVAGVSPTGPVELEPGAQFIDGYEVVVDRVDRVCRVAPIGLWSAIFDAGTTLGGRLDERGNLVIEADGVPAWLPGERRLGVAWYQPGSNGYLSVLARERTGWTSSP
jgi:tRNA(Ile)-lysidine synthase